MKNAKVITIARNNKVFATSLICYAIFLGIVLLENNNAFAIRQITFVSGLAAFAVYCLVRFIGSMSLKKVTPLTLEAIKVCFKQKGISFTSSKDGVSFTVGETGVPVNLSYDQVNGNLSLVIAMMSQGNERSRMMAIRACMAVMDKMPNVRLFLSSECENENQIFVKIEAGMKVSSIEAFKQHFASNVKDLLDAQEAFMKNGEEIAKSLKEAESKTKKVGFYSEMKEKIDNFKKQHPAATDEEVNKYIDSIR